MGWEALRTTYIALAAPDVVHMARGKLWCSSSTMTSNLNLQLSLLMSFVPRINLFPGSCCRLLQMWRPVDDKSHHGAQHGLLGAVRAGRAKIKVGRSGKMLRPNPSNRNDKVGLGLGRSRYNLVKLQLLR